MTSGKMIILESSGNLSCVFRNHPETSAVLSVSCLRFALHLLYNATVDILVIVYCGDSLTLGYIYIERRDLMPRFVTVERAWRSVFFPCKGLGCVVGVGWVGWDIES